MHLKDYILTVKFLAEQEFLSAFASDIWWL